MNDDTKLEKEIKTILDQLAGAASLCWTPKGVFDSTQAISSVQQATNKIMALNTKLLSDLAKCRAALEKLANEAQGFQSLANVADHGHTNMECLALRIREARQALKETE